VAPGFVVRPIIFFIENDTDPGNFGEVWQSTPSVQSYTIKASVRQYRAREIAGMVQQGDREVRIAAVDLTFTPRQNDQVVIGGKTFQVVSVNTRSPFNEAAIHIVQVRGGNG
jgi:hypothetical protein